jgi:hypothetical protein
LNFDGDAGVEQSVSGEAMLREGGGILKDTCDGGSELLVV